MKKILLLIILGGISCCAISQVNPCNPTGAPYSSLPGDTTIVLPSGSTITLNRCEFFDIRDCFEVKELVDTADLRRAGLSMYDKKGNVLVSCGMVSVSFKNCDKTCLDVPFKLRIKSWFNDCSKSKSGVPALYKGSGGRWEKLPDSSVRYITQNNQQYLEVTGGCSMTVNCDKPERGRKVKFIAPAGRKIEQLRVGINCPLFYVDEKLVIPKRRYKIWMLCNSPNIIDVQSGQRDSKTDSLITTRNKLSELKGSHKKVSCNEPKRTFLGRLFSWSSTKGELHKKYYLR